MKKTYSTVLFIGILILPFMTYPALGIAGVDINVGVNLGLPPPPPPFVMHAPPPVVVVPNTYVYYIPDAQVDIFFYHGHWYRPHGGRWYRANGYNGPWTYIERERVPVAIHHLPPNYRHIPPGHQRIPYGQLKANWRTWEKEKHWDRSKPEHGGRRGYSEGRWENNQGHGKGKGWH